MTTSASSESGNPKSRRTCVCHRRVTPTRIITTFIVITCSSDFVPIVGGNDDEAFKSCHTFLDYSLASTILSRCCHHHLQGSLPVIKVTVVIIVVIAFATSIAEDSPDQIYFSPGHQPGRFRSLVSANGQGSSFQLLFRSSKISPSTLHFPFALIPNLIRTNLKLGLFFF